MPTEHKLRKGEGLSAIAQKYGLRPETIWNDQANAGLRGRRKNQETLYPGDSIVIPDKITKKESAPTGNRHRYVVMEIVGLVIRLDIDPSDASTHDDRFVLRSTDGSYRNEKTVKDDQVPGDKYLDLHYTGLRKTKRYTLEVIASEYAQPQIIFEKIPYAELCGMSENSVDSYGEPYASADEYHHEERYEEEACEETSYEEENQYSGKYSSQKQNSKQDAAYSDEHPPKEESYS
jgi:hypothetical protein